MKGRLVTGRGREGGGVGERWGRVVGRGEGGRRGRKV